MLLQYAPLLLTALLPKDAPRGLPVRRRGAQGLRRGLENLSSAVGDGRVLFRLFGQSLRSRHSAAEHSWSSSASFNLTHLDAI
jgi:hypothetical protein